VNPHGNPGSCWQTTRLRSTSSGWPGKCLDLAHLGSLTQDLCKQACERNPFCSIWQYNNATQCWQGIGRACDDGAGTLAIEVQAAERLQHGRVTVLKDMKGWDVSGLQGIGSWTTRNTTGGNAEACKFWCYSNIKCQFWQYGSSGCWVENPDAGYTVEYPLVEGSGASQTSSFATSMVAGEYVQHYCPLVPSGVELVEGTKGEDSETALLWLIVALVLMLLLSGLAIGCLMKGGKDRDPSSAVLPTKKRDRSSTAASTLSASSVREEAPLMSASAMSPGLTPQVSLDPLAFAGSLGEQSVYR